jgi:hypothetical protein
MLLKLNPHGHIAEDPRQANLRITLTPMTAECRPAVSVVASCFDEDVLPLFFGRVGDVPDSLGGTSELVLVDHGSSDRTWEAIEKAAVEDSGTQFLMLGSIGADHGRLYDQSKGRPLFPIRDMVEGAARGSAPTQKQASTPPPPAAQLSR